MNVIVIDLGRRDGRLASNAKPRWTRQGQTTTKNLGHTIKSDLVEIVLPHHNVMTTPLSFWYLKYIGVEF